MKMKSILCGICALLMCTSPAWAASSSEGDKVEFNPHWYMQIQGGVGHTIGEADFGKLISPAAALSAGYRFTPVWGIRFGVSGWESKGAWAYPQNVYSYNYLQGNVEVTLDLANLFGRFNPTRTVNPYLFAGAGINGAFNNDEANALNDQGYKLEYLWSDSKILVAGRVGLGVDFRLSDCVSLGLEVNSNILSDKYNSKKAGNVDWQFNALAGLSFRFGKGYKKAPKVVVPETPAQEPAPEPAPEPEVKPEPAPAAPVVEAKPAEMRQDIFFKINSSQIRESEQGKITSLVEFLKANPEAKVQVTGYADAATGTAAINQRISKQRAESVAAALKKAGVSADRISVESKGDTVQPFSGVEQNRVSICIAK